MARFLSSRPIYIVIEGLVGSGKTTLCERLAESLDSCFRVLPEPVDAFQSYKNYNPLQLAYENPIHNAAIAQVHIIQSSYKFYSKILSAEYPGVTHLITERSMESPLVFIETNKTRKIHSEFVGDFLKDFCLKFSEQVPPPNVIIYLNAHPELCLDRIAARSRIGEQHCDLEYLTLMSSAYDAYLQECLSQRQVLLHRVSITPKRSREDILQEVISLINDSSTRLSPFLN